LLFAVAHRQYLITNAYNITMIARVFCVTLGLGIVFAWTRSLIPSIIAHAIINVPMTPVWQGALLVVFAIGALFAWPGGCEPSRGLHRHDGGGLRGAGCAGDRIRNCGRSNR
jgi:membrane protease YdiL (CAAX protease family)